MNKQEDRLIQVCTECGRASCWHGEFMCDNSKGAGLELKTAKELDAKQFGEDKHHYSVEMIEKVFGEKYPFGFKEAQSE